MSDLQETDTGTPPYLEHSNAESKERLPAEEQGGRLSDSEIETRLKQINEARYLKHSDDESEEQEGQLSLSEIEALITEQERELKIPNRSDTIRNAILSFNIYPERDPSRYFIKANIARSSAAALASDWNNVFKDLHVSFLRGIAKIKR